MEYILLDCPFLQEARNDIFTHAGPNLRFDDARTAQVIAFLRRTGLGSSPDTHGWTLKDGPEADDLDVGPIGGLSPDLDP